MIKVLFFASLKESLDCAGLEVADSDAGSVAQLRRLLVEKGPLWETVLGFDSTLVAVNQTMATDQTALQAGDEVAFFPPVTGG
jgi:molybdopterin synthase sulfur carrier subunit